MWAVGVPVRILLLSPARNLSLNFLASTFWGKFSFSNTEKETLAELGTLFQDGGRKNLFWVIQKSFRYQQWVFPGSKESRISNNIF
jgi:hypothetical protein